MPIKIQRPLISAACSDELAAGLGDAGGLLCGAADALRDAVLLDRSAHSVMPISFRKEDRMLELLEWMVFIVLLG